MFYILVNLFIGGKNMVALYVALIINNRRTFEADLEALGLDENGYPV